LVLHVGQVEMFNTEQNTFYFKRVHSTEFSTLTYTTYNTREKWQKRKKKKNVVISQFGESM